MMTAETSDSTSVVPAWGRFLLRLGAIAWPLLTYLAIETLPGTPATERRVQDCTPAVLGGVMLVLTLLGMLGLVCAANMAGCRQRYALAIAATIAAAWAILAVVMHLIAPGTRCDLGMS